MPAGRSTRERVGVSAAVALLVIGLAVAPALVTTVAPVLHPVRMDETLALGLASWQSGPYARSSPAAALATVTGPAVSHEVLVSGNLQGTGTWEAYDPTAHILFAVWQSAVGVGFARSLNGGASFQAPVTVPGSEDSFTNTSYSFSFNPTVSVSATGIVYVAFAYSTLNLTTFATPAGVPIVAVSFNHGASFAYATPVAPLDPLAFTDSPYVAAGPGEVVGVSWMFAPNGSSLQSACDPLLPACGYGAGDVNAVFAESRNAGASWGPMRPINPGYPYGGGDADPLVILPSGQIDVLYQKYSMNPTTYALSAGREYFSSSSNGGASWSSPVAVSSSRFTENDTEYWLDGSLAVSASGTLVAAWDSQTPGGDIGWVSDSVTGGRSWSTPVQVTDTPSAVHLLSVVPGPAGTAYVGWIANDRDGGWEGYLVPFTVASGRLGTAVRVSSLVSVPGSYTGDTLGLAYLGGGVVSAAWGIELNESGNVSIGVYNVIANFG